MLHKLLGAVSHLPQRDLDHKKIHRRQNQLAHVVFIQQHLVITSIGILLSTPCTISLSQYIIIIPHPLDYSTNNVVCVLEIPSHTVRSVHTLQGRIQDFVRGVEGPKLLQFRFAKHIGHVDRGVLSEMRIYSSEIFTPYLFTGCTIALSYIIIICILNAVTMVIYYSSIGILHLSDYIP